MVYRNNTVLNSETPLTEADISALEHRIGEALPSDLRQHFLNYNGGQLSKRDFTAKNGDLYHLHEFLPVGSERNRGFELSFEVARKDPGFMPEDLVPFAIDEGGAYFCIRHSDGSIVFFNPENADNLDWAIVDLSPSLRDFVDGMV